MTLAQHAADLFGVALSTEQIGQFDRLQTELIAWNQHTNLTAITDPDGIQVRHFLDSLSIARSGALLPGTSVIDVGTGAGFPGLPLAIAYPQASVTLMDATGKKVAFVQHIIDTLGLTNARAFQARAEDAGQDAAHREQYDLVLARAVARLPGLLEYLLPLCKVGGCCIAMKGATAQEEAQSAARALDAFGGVLEGIQAVNLPTIEHAHYLVTVKKVTKTPGHYPRQPGIPTRKPLA